MIYTTSKTSRSWILSYSLFLTLQWFSHFDLSGQYTYRNSEVYGSTATDKATCVSGSGSNVIIGGEFQGTFDLAPTEIPSGNISVASLAGSRGAFLKSFDVGTGSMNWFIDMGTDSNFGFVDLEDVAMDGLGNVYCTGHYTFQAKPDGIIDSTAVNSGHIFVSKFDNSGNSDWFHVPIRSDPFTNSPISSGSLTVDASGNVYVVATVTKGTGASSFDFGNGVSVNLSGSSEIIVYKLNSMGEAQWAVNFGATSQVSNGNAIALSTDGNTVLFSGTFSGTVDFDPDIATTANHTATGSNDLVISSLNTSDGSYGGWTHVSVGSGTSLISSDLNSEIHSITIDASNNVYVTGDFAGAVDFGGGTLNSALASTFSTSSAFVVSVQGDGTFRWAIHSEGGSGGFDFGGTYPTGITLDLNDGIVITGKFETPGAYVVDFDPGVAANNQSSSGSTDGFIWYLDNSVSPPTLSDIILIGGSGADAANDLYFHSTEDLTYIAGEFSGTNIDMDASAGTDNKSAVGGTDIFYQRLGSSTLPVELVSFNVDEDKDRVHLIWTTASEQNNDFFDIQRTDDPLQWETIGRVYGSGNSTELMTYNFKDYNPLSTTSYYRLKQVDYDGTISHSSIKRITLSCFNYIHAYPNPADEILTVYSCLSRPQVRIFNINGQKVNDQVKIISIKGSEIIFAIDSLAPGKYIVSDGNVSESFIKK